MPTKVIGVADCGISADEKDVLTTYALGSCIAVTLYDPVSRVGGMLHFLLPNLEAGDTTRRRDNPYVYADTGVADMIEGCLRLGAAKPRLRVCAAGGANVMRDAAFFDIGRRNHLSLRKVLWKKGLLLHAEDVGGDCWRTVRLHMSTGKVWIKKGSLPELELGVTAGKATRATNEIATGR